MKFNDTYVKNMQFFKEFYPEVYEKISSYKEDKQFNLVKSSISEKEFFNIEEKESKYLAYQEDPYIQAEDFAQKALLQDPWLIFNNEDKSSISNIDKIIFISSGLGYTLEAYNKRYDLKSILLVEPNIEIFTYSCHVVNYKKLAQDKQFRICLDVSSENLEAEVTLFYNTMFFYNNSFKVSEFFKNEILLEVSVFLDNHLKVNPLLTSISYDKVLKGSSFKAGEKELLEIVDKLNKGKLNKNNLELIVQLMDQLRMPKLKNVKYYHSLDSLFLALLKITVFGIDAFSKIMLSYSLAYFIAQSKLGKLEDDFYIYIFDLLKTSAITNESLRLEFLTETLKHLNEKDNKNIILLERVKYLIQSAKNSDLKQSPEEYISAEFDGFAESFDKQLLENLKYSVPNEMKKAIEIVAKEDKAYNILDLGCGTGLVGELIKEKVESLIGVDLSEKMLEEARKKGVYTELVKSDIQSYLDTLSKDSVEIVTAADLFIYIGELESIFKSTNEILSEDGLFVFSTELLESDRDYFLNRTGRFSHSTGYIERLIDLFSFKLITDKDIIVRKENNIDVKGKLYVLSK